MSIGNEERIWNGRPSQVVNFGSYLFCGLFFWLVFPILIIIWKWLSIKTTRYELTSERLKIRRGILNKKTDELELYRVRDYSVEKPLFIRLFSLGNVILETSDKSHPTVIIRAVKDSERLCDEFRTHVEASRKAKGVREVSVD